MHNSTRNILFISDNTLKNFFFLNLYPNYVTHDARALVFFKGVIQILFPFYSKPTHLQSDAFLWKAGSTGKRLGTFFVGIFPPLVLK